LKTSAFEIPCWIFDIQYPFKLSRALVLDIESNNEYEYDDENEEE